MAQLVARYLGVVEAARSSRVTQTRSSRWAFARRLILICAAPLERALYRPAPQAQGGRVSEPQTIRRIVCGEAVAHQAGSTRCETRLAPRATLRLRAGQRTFKSCHSDQIAPEISDFRRYFAIISALFREFSTTFAFFTIPENPRPHI